MSTPMYCMCLSFPVVECVQTAQYVVSPVYFQTSCGHCAVCFSSVSPQQRLRIVLKVGPVSEAQRANKCLHSRFKNKQKWKARVLN